MITYKRICVTTMTLTEGADSITVERGKEYITSDVKPDEDGQPVVTVFGTFWAPFPVGIFAGARRFT